MYQIFLFLTPVCSRFFHPLLYKHIFLKRQLINVQSFLYFLDQLIDHQIIFFLPPIFLQNIDIDQSKDYQNHHFLPFLYNLYLIVFIYNFINLYFIAFFFSFLLRFFFFYFLVINHYRYHYQDPIMILIHLIKTLK